MGRIKTLMVKRTAVKLLEQDDVYSTDFMHNKKILGNTMPSKPIRNKIAGYLARLKRQQTQKKTPKAPAIAEEAEEQE